jgi:ribosomal protein S24E
MFTLSSNNVRDKVAYVEGSERLVLTVDVDPIGFFDSMNGVIADLKKLNNESTDDDYMRVAVDMAHRMFGKEQTDALIDFYHGNKKQIFSMVTRYFLERLNILITEKQKKLGRKKRLFK